MGEYENIRTRAGLPIEKASLDVRQFSELVKKDELVRLILLGLPTRACAEKMGLSVQTIRHYLHIEAVQQEIKTKNAGIWQRIDDEITTSRLSLTERITHMSDKALEKISQLIDSEDERVAMKASSDILDRNPETSRTHKVESTSMVMKVDADQLRLAAKTAMEIDNHKVIEGV
jgi:DNA-binding transcriptional MerR regulator